MLLSGLPSGRSRTILAGALAALAAVVLVRTLYHNRARYNDTDYNHYYANALKLRMGGNPWRPSQPDRPEARMSFNYPPAFYLMFSPLTRLEPRTGYWLWQAAQVLSLIAAILIALDELRPRPGVQTVIAALALAFLFPQVYGSLYDSQPTALLLLMLIGAWRLARRGRDGWAGALLAAAALLKIYPAVVGGYFLFRGRIATVGYAILYFVAGQCALLGLYGLRLNSDFFSAVRMAMVPFWLDMDRNVSITSNVHYALVRLCGGSLGPFSGKLHLVIAALLELAVIALAGAFTIDSEGGEPEADGLCWSLWLITAILLSPLAWAHYLLLLIPLYIFAVAHLVRLREVRHDTSARALRLSAGLLALGFLGFVLPYFAVPLRNLHTYFFALIITFAGTCLLLQASQGRG